MEFAVRAGDTLAGVVAMATDAENSRTSAAGLERELEDSAAPSRIDRTHLGPLAVVGRSAPAHRAELIATMHRREDPVVWTSDLIGWATQDLRPSLSQIACPPHLLVGEDDLWLDAADVAWAAEQIPLAQLTVLEGIGHYPMEEVEGFAEVLHGWLDDHGSQRVLEPPTADSAARSDVMRRQRARSRLIAERTGSRTGARPAAPWLGAVRPATSPVAPVPS